MEKIINYRPLAEGLTNKYGKRIKDNSILRSGEVGKATGSDMAKLAGYGVKYIYDFRNAEETVYIPALPSSQFTTLHIDVISEASPYAAERLIQMAPGDVKGMMIMMYATMFSKTDAYRTAIEAITAQETDAFLFHCSAGKDRTGVFGAILMMAMDFDTEAIAREYLRIDADAIGQLKADMLRHIGQPEDTTRFDHMFTVRREYLCAYLEAIIDAHGSTDQYLAEMVGITETEKAYLQQRYLV